ncbi:hypothetical protein AG1IA_08500 [Rhizoctonia solani AG-1 IA]|uniref:Uncharacterized protein n=1 Tax=Thanatephorus cucumeris (strain AG1-IA) TaxID=983506 RepID=L8WM86_THACA|nr:hypothetical protein AG1IA_08500 [Rhizoctonia solani AG-1 IA]
MGVTAIRSFACPILPHPSTRRYPSPAEHFLSLQIRAHCFRPVLADRPPPRNRFFESPNQTQSRKIRPRSSESVRVPAPAMRAREERQGHRMPGTTPSCAQSRRRPRRAWSVVFGCGA